MKYCIVLLFMFFALSNGNACASEKLVLQLPWHHQFQFAGYYMAKENGYFHDAGLDVDIRDVSWGSYSVDEVISGKADFGVSASGLLVERSQGKSVVVVATIFQQDPIVFIALKKSGIREPADLINKKVMLSPGFQSLSLLALLHQEHLFDKVERVDTNFDFNSLLTGQADVFNAYRTNETYLLETQGNKVTIIDPQDYGIQFYGDTLFTSETFLQNNPKVVEKFRKACLKGWEYALEHPDKTIAVIQTKYHSNKTVPQLQFEAAAVAEIIQADRIEIGSMDVARWAQINQHLIAIGAIPAKFQLSGDFLYNPPPGFDWNRLRPWIIGILSAFAVLCFFLILLLRVNVKLKSAQQEVQKSEQKFRLLADYTYDWEYWLNPEGNYVYVSPSCERTTGYRPDEFKSNPKLIFDLVHPDYAEAIHQHYADENNLKTPLYSMEFPIRTKAGEERWLEHHCSPVFDEQGNYAGRRGNNRDITKRKLAEEKQKALLSKLEAAHQELKSSQSKLLQSEKMASIGQLAAGVAHEINNPMGFISQNLRSLQKYTDKLAIFIAAQKTALDQSSGYDDELKSLEKKLKLNYLLEDIKDLIEESLDGSDRVQTIVKNLKTFSRVDQDGAQSTDLNDCIDGTISIIWNELKYKATIEKDYGDLPSIICFPQQLSQVFMNLLINASHSIETQGVIKIKSWSDEVSAYVSITDNGCGIDPDTLKRIFEPFFTTKEVGSGTGLGLSMVYDIVKSHQGEISVDSEIGQGTTFTVKLARS